MPSFKRLMANPIIFMLVQILVALDQLANALLGGWADETLSARAWRTEQDGRLWGRICRPLIDLLFFIQPNHCAIAYAAEVERQQLPPEFRKSRP